MAKVEPAYEPRYSSPHVPNLSLGKMSGHDFESMYKRPFNSPNALDAEQLRNAYMKTSGGKVEPMLVKMSNTTPRDNAMYPKIGDIE